MMEEMMTNMEEAQVATLMMIVQRVIGEVLVIHHLLHQVDNTDSEIDHLAMVTMTTEVQVGMIVLVGEEGIGIIIVRRGIVKDHGVDRAVPHDIDGTVLLSMINVIVLRHLGN